MTKTYKNIPSLHRFVEVAPVEAIRKLLAEHGGGDNAKAFASVEWPNASVPNGVNRDFRLGVLGICAGLDARLSAPVDAGSILTI
jgi:hypothetical protein